MDGINCRNDDHNDYDEIKNDGKWWGGRIDMYACSTHSGKKTSKTKQQQQMLFKSKEDKKIEIFIASLGIHCHTNEWIYGNH